MNISIEEDALCMVNNQINIQAFWDSRKERLWFYCHKSSNFWVHYKALGSYCMQSNEYSLLLC
jgi:hypothetical protein